MYEVEIRPKQYIDSLWDTTMKWRKMADDMEFMVKQGWAITHVCPIDKNNILVIYEREKQ